MQGYRLAFIKGHKVIHTSNRTSDHDYIPMISIITGGYRGNITTCMENAPVCNRVVLPMAGSHNIISSYLAIYSY